MRAPALLLLALIGVWARPAAALDDTDPPFRFGVGAGAYGTQPLGGDLRQEGAQRDEFSRALWLHLDLLTLDLGDHFSLGAYAALSLTGGVDRRAIEAAIEPAALRRMDGSSASAHARGDLTQWGLRGRYFPFGDGRFRPFLGAGVALAVSRAKFETPLGGALQVQAERDPGSVTPEELALAAAGGGFRRSNTEAYERTHRGVALSLSLGVRWDLHATTFGEPVRLPLSLEVQYTRNQWLSLDPAEQVERAPTGLAPEGMQLDYLGVVVTLGYLR